MSIEATPRELAETLVHTRSIDQRSYRYIGEVEIGEGFWSLQVKLQLRVALQRLIEDERRRADEMVRRAVENCRAGVGT